MGQSLSLPQYWSSNLSHSEMLQPGNRQQATANSPPTSPQLQFFFPKSSQCLTFKVHEEETCDGSVLSRVAPNRLADPRHPLFEKRAGGPVMSSASDTPDRWGSAPPRSRILGNATDGWAAGGCLHRHRNPNGAVIIITVNIARRHVHVQWFPKSERGGGQLEHLIARAGTGAFQNLQALIKNPLWAQIHQKCGHYAERQLIIPADVVLCMHEL